MIGQIFNKGILTLEKKVKNTEFNKELSKSQRKRLKKQENRNKPQKGKGKK